jgi:protein-tyrosine phosphatase
LIDLHSHYLFDVDDGARTLEDSLSMLRTAAEDGTEVMVATPHQHQGNYHVPPDRARRRLEEVKAAVEREGIPIDLRLAAEIHFTPGIKEGLADGSLLPLSEDGRFFLLEMPVTNLPSNLDEILFALRIDGRFAVLAHPERNFEIMRNPKIARTLREQGVLLQLTAMSITGAFGGESEKASRKLLKWGCVDVIASDAHNPARRPPGLSEGVAAAARVVGRKEAERMVTENPERILDGRGVD